MLFHPICGRKKCEGASTPLRIFLAVTVRLSAYNCVATRRREVAPAFDTDLVGLLRTKESVGLPPPPVVGIRSQIFDSCPTTSRSCWSVPVHSTADHSKPKAA